MDSRIVPWTMETLGDLWRPLATLGDPWRPCLKMVILTIFTIFRRAQAWISETIKYFRIIVKKLVDSKNPLHYPLVDFLVTLKPALLQLLCQHLVFNQPVNNSTCLPSNNLTCFA